MDIASIASEKASENGEFSNDNIGSGAVPEANHIDHTGVRETGSELAEYTEHDIEGDGDPVSAPKKTRPTPESVAIDREIQNVARKAHKHSKGSEKKLVDLLIQVFENCGSPEEKLEALARKYVQLAADQKDAEQKMTDFESKLTKTRKERDHLQSEYNKLLIAKGKLESLCRELQKHNKAIKEETQRRTDDEERKRKELSQKFQGTINDITQQMADNHKRNQQLKQDNNDLAQKLKGLVEQYEIREQHIEKVLKAKQLELQLCEAKLQQQNLVMQEEVESNLKEKHSVLEESLIYKRKCEELLRQEAELRSQLALYTQKFEEFQNTLTKSNEVFGTFKKDMDTMTKTIRKLEKESQMWKGRWENTNRSLLAMVEERTQNQENIATQKAKIEKLEKLCRALQTERKSLRKQAAPGKGDEADSISPSPEPSERSDSSDPLQSATPSPRSDFTTDPCGPVIESKPCDAAGVSVGDVPETNAESEWCDTAQGSTSPVADESPAVISADTDERKSASEASPAGVESRPSIVTACEAATGSDSHPTDEKPATS